MSNQTNTFAQAYSAFQQGDYAVARELLTGSDHPQAAHLLGLVERRLGKFDQALVCLERALQGDPNNPEIYHNQALTYLDLSELSQAFTSVSKAMALKPDFVAAHRTCGRILRESERWVEACDFYRGFLERWPEDRVAQYGLGMAELETGDAEQALGRFERLVQSGATDGSIYFMHGRAALESGNVALARKSLTEAHRMSPAALTLRELGRLYWMQNDRDAFASLLAGPFESPQMTAVALQLLRQSGAAADDLASTLARAPSTTADQQATVAQAYVDQGAAEQAHDYALAALANEPGHDAAMAARISALLMQGQTEEALVLARDKGRAAPNAQQWIAYEATALRLLGSNEYKTLVDLDQHVRVYSLPVPKGYDSLADFNSELEQALEQLQLFESEPVDQSLRGGTQTARDLRGAPSPVIQAYLQALDEPIRDYIMHMGISKTHPLSRRNTGDYALNGCWSVRLSCGGHHVNHMHPEGWISSAYYVRVPASRAETRAGWIHFSQPPFRTAPVLEPERWIEPKSGMLVLFPSYLWHGTEPIVDDAVRITAPFDAVPR